MAQVNVQLSVGNRIFNKTKIYTNVLERSYELDNTDSFHTIFSSASGIAADSLQAIKAICIYNQSDVAAEIMIKNQDWKDAGTGDTENSVDVSGGGASNDRYHTVLLPAGDFLYLPNGRFLDYFSQT